MALVLADRVQEITTTSGTGTITLSGAVPGFQDFLTGIGSGNTTFYTIYDPTTYEWEVGIGTFTSSGTDTLSRDTVLSNSLGTTAKINLAGNQTNVFVTYPSEKSVNLDSSGNVSPLGTISSGTWQGSTVGVAYGGTGVTSSSGANSVVLRDTNQNIVANKISQSVDNITASGGTTTLTAASAFWQTLQGTGAHTIKLPDATTLPIGFWYIFDNDSTGNLTIQDFGSTTLDIIPPGGYSLFYLDDISSVAGSWNRAGLIPSEVNWGTNNLDLGGLTTVTNGAWQGDPVAPAYGGTGLNSFSAANNALYSTGATTLTAGTLPIAAGGTGQTTANAALNALLPSQSSNSGKYLTTDGTNSSWATVTQTTFSAGTTGFTPSTPTSGAVTLAGTLNVANGGTGLTSLTANYIPYGNGTSAYQSSASFTYNGTALSTNGLVVSTNSSSDAVRITQTGSGNALLVEDSANPDASPFVITSSGVVRIGTLNSLPSGIQYDLQIASDNTSEGVAIASYVNAATGAFLALHKSRATSVGSNTVVQSGDTLGQINFRGDDGTGSITAATILGAVDGTPGTNDMPGRIVFSTTADGASSPTERMRINSSGNVGIGNTSITNTSLRLGNIISGSTTAYGIYNGGVIQSDVTFSAIYTGTVAATQATTFTLANLYHFSANQGTFGVGSTVTDQMGFFASGNLIGATNNYGFFSNLASGTGRWNFYANGTAPNYFAGNVYIGTTTPNITTYPVFVESSTGIMTSAGTNTAATSPSFSTSRRRTGGASVVSGDSTGKFNSFGWDGASFIENARIEAAVDGTPGTNDMPGRIVFSTTADGASSPTERMRIDSSGNVGIGTASPFGGNSLLTVATGITIADDGSPNPYLNFYNTGAGTDLKTWRIGTTTGGVLQIQTVNDAYTSATSRIVIDSAGNVGMGTSSPSALNARLAVVGNIVATSDTDYQPQTVLIGASATAGSAPYFISNRSRGTTASRTAVTNNDQLGTVLFGGYDGTSFISTSGIFSAVDGAVSTNNVPSRLAFATGTAATALERMRIDSSGNVGIGTVPSYKFHVVGDVSGGPVWAAFQNNNASANSTGGILTVASGANNYTALYNAVGGLTYLQAAGAAGFSISTVQSTPIIFSTGTTERMRITAAGNVGIGTANPGSALEVQGRITIGNATGAGSLIMPDATGNPLLQLVTDTQTARECSIINNWGNSSNTGVMVGTSQSGGIAFQVQSSIPITSGLPSGAGTTRFQVQADGTAVFSNAIQENVYAVVDAAGVAISPQNGTIQTWTLGASRTPTAGTWDAGESLTLMINDGTAYTVTWTTIGVVWVGGIAPTLATTGFTVIELWKVGTTIYGALVGSVA